MTLRNSIKATKKLLAEIDQYEKEYIEWFSFNIEAKETKLAVSML